MDIRNITKTFVFYIFVVLFPTAAFSETMKHSTDNAANPDSYIVKIDHTLFENNLDDITSEMRSFSDNLSTKKIIGKSHPTKLQNESGKNLCKLNSNSFAPATQEKQFSEIGNNQHKVIATHNTECNIEAKAYPLGDLLSVNQANPKIALDPIKPSKLPLVPAGFSKLILESPTSPAAKLIGSDKQIKSISTSSALAAQLLNGLNSDGDFQTGVAVDFLPYSLIRGDSLSLGEYRSSRFQRFLANTKFSVATVPAPGSNARAALGVEFMLINDSDPRIDMEYQRELDKISVQIPDKAKFPCFPGQISNQNCFTNADRLALIQKMAPDVEAAQKEAKKRLEQNPVWVLGIGQSWVSTTGSYQNLQGEGMSLWTTYKLGLGGNSKLLLHASLRNGERQKQKDNSFANVDTLVGGVRLLSGDDNFRFSLETTYNRESQELNRINDNLYFGVGLEPRIADNTWLAVSFGGSTGRQNGADLQFTTGLKWNFNPGSASD